MRGIVLAGGTGSRLGALTKCVNKHLLPVGGQPMIEWPLKVLRANGITDITIVSSPRGTGQLAEYLGGGYTYRVQEKPGGIVQAISCAVTGQEDDNIAVILGDNIFFEMPVIPTTYGGKACCFLKSVPSNLLHEFGVAAFDDEGEIVHIIEKPSKPPSNYAVTGLYVLPYNVFKILDSIEPSKRNEIEITSLLNKYARQGMLVMSIIPNSIFWGDAGTIHGMYECSAAALQTYPSLIRK